MVSNSKENLSNFKAMLVDVGYTGIPFLTAIKQILGVTVEMAKRDQSHKFVVIPKR